MVIEQNGMVYGNYLKALFSLRFIGALLKTNLLIQWLIAVTLGVMDSFVSGFGANPFESKPHRMSGMGHRTGVFTGMFLAVFHIGCAKTVDTQEDDAITPETLVRVVQFDVASVLNARVVTTLHQGNLVAWNRGIDGEWSGLATFAAADTMGSVGRVALPDDGVFPADERHPLMVLHLSNRERKSNQVRFIDRFQDDRFSFRALDNNYTGIELVFMSALGRSEVTVVLHYADAGNESHFVSVEDWGVEFPDTNDRYCLVSNLAKWNRQNQEMEPDRHYLTGVHLPVDPRRKLESVEIFKPQSETSLVFWGAVGQGTSEGNWTVPADDRALCYEGRVAPGAGGGMRLGYPGTIFRTHFRGTGIQLETEALSDEVFLDVQLDGETPFFLQAPKGRQMLPLARGLPFGDHRLEVFKRVESCVGEMDILSVSVQGDFLPPPPLSSPKLLFLGDSFVCGQATTVEDGDVNIDPSKAMRENARLSFGRLLADRLGAQCHIIAYAGRGIMRDWQGSNAVLCAPEYYEFAIPDDDTTVWDPSKYVPDAIGICLGSNDFDVGIPDQLTYLATYTEFIRKLRRDAPDATIFLISSPSLKDEPEGIPLRSVLLAYLHEVVRRLDDAKVKVIELPTYPVVPGDWHPSGTAHRAVADLLEPDFRNALGR